MTVQNSHADLGAFRHDTLLFFEKALVHMGNLVNGLVRIGFPLANMVVMALSELWIRMYGEQSSVS